MPADPLHDVLRSFVECLVSVHHVHPIRVRVDIEEDPDHPLSWRLKEMAGALSWQPNGQTSPERAEEVSNPDAETHFSACIPDILDVLEKAAKPLTTTRILAALSQAGKEWSDRTVSTYLALMVRDGTLENPEGAKPRGYRLPEWTAED